jgi:hypothetical protein
MTGSQTVRGRTVNIDAGFIDIIEKSDSIIALMTYFEARNGPLSLFADLVYSKLGASGSRSTRVGAVGASLDIQMTTLEVGATYEAFRWAGTPGSHTALDVLAGGRFWWQRADLSIGFAGGRGIARSGDVSWGDPFVGVRLRHQFAPHHELALRGDIGGFEVGSRFSWQLVGTYSWEFSSSGSVAWAAVIGYRALSVDYVQGAGRTRYAFDMVQHGPILGISMRF